ncbi:CsgG/HfaB family protein [Thermomonas brevis]
MQVAMKHFVMAGVLILLVACGKKEADKLAAPVDSSPVAQSNKEDALRNSPDFGGTTKVSREAEGIGSTPELAVVAALQSAVAQVNGVRVAGQMQGIRAGLDVSLDGREAGSLLGDAFVQQVIASSHGAVLGYEILSQEEIDKIDEETIARVRASDGGYSYSASGSVNADYSASASGSLAASEDAKANAGRASAGYSGSFSGEASSKESASYQEKGEVEVNRGASSYSSDHAYRKMRSYWKVRIRADIARYRAPDEKGRPKIVVASPRVLSASYPVGDGRVPSGEVATAIRSRLSDILTQTKRFIVLDREFGDEMQAEIDKINGGDVRLQDSARLGQQLATDLILIPTIERFEYAKSVQQLRMANRQVVSYAGGGRVGLRLLNAATGEVVMSDSFDYQLPSSGPSTLPRFVDGKGMAATMMDSLSGRIGNAIVTEIFPVSVVALNGDQVVLSQGGDTLSVGERWQAVALGEELKDPQTGNSLGRNEMPCCTIRVDRVSSQTSYGTIEEGVASLGDAAFRPGMIELRNKVDSIKSSAHGAQQQAASAPSKSTHSAKPKPASDPEPKDDPNW